MGHNYIHSLFSLKVPDGFYRILPQIKYQTADFSLPAFITNNQCLQKNTHRISCCFSHRSLAFSVQISLAPARCSPVLLLKKKKNMAVAALSVQIEKIPGNFHWYKRKYYWQPIPFFEKHKAAFFLFYWVSFSFR